MTFQLVEYTFAYAGKSEVRLACCRINYCRHLFPFHRLHYCWRQEDHCLSYSYSATSTSVRYALCTFLTQEETRECQISYVPVPIEWIVIICSYWTRYTYICYSYYTLLSLTYTPATQYCTMHCYENIFQKRTAQALHYYIIRLSR